MNRPTNHMKRLALHMKREEPHAGRIRPYTAQNLAFTGAGMNKQSSDARIAVRIPKESDLKERLVATSKGTGIPEAVLMLRPVEALVAYYYEDSGHLRLPLEVRPQEQTEIYNLQ